MDKGALGVAWLAVACVGLAGAAWMFRFEPMQAGGNTFMWDRWHQQPCVVLAAMAPLVCSKVDLERMSQASGDLPAAGELLGPAPQQ